MMTARKSLLGAVLAALTLCPAGASAQERSIAVANETLGNIQVTAPADEPRLFAISISDKDGVTQARRTEAERLVAQGAAVALIDLPDLQKRVSASDDTDCHYTFGDFEDLTRVAERALGMAKWRWPVLLGTGDGGALAYLALAQAPDNTTAGAVSVGFTPEFATRLPMCGGAPHLGHVDGVQRYGPATDLPSGWRWIAASVPAADLATFASASPKARLEIVPDDGDARFSAAMNAVIELGAPPTGTLADLPLVELPAKGELHALAVFISGDGGWRDVDKQIGEYLQAHGVAVVGIDALRYFWSKKRPEVVATDLARIVKYYQQLWQVHSTALLGYSFGADMLPLAWGKMDGPTRDAIDLIGLMGLEPTADLEVTVSGWLGIASTTEIPIEPYLSAMPAEKVMCVYGVEEAKENDTACTMPEFGKASRLIRPGGHHFDGNYEAVADAIVARLVPRVASSAIR